MTTHHVPSSLRKAVLNRDGNQCRKCCKSQALEAHHIQSMLDGGETNADNLITLCLVCHSEWHIFNDSFDLPFERWLDLPSYTEMVAFFMQTIPDTLSGREIQDAFKTAITLHRQSNQW